MEYLYNQGKITSNEFAFYLSSSPGSEASKLTIGGFDSKYAPNGFNYVPLVSESYWMISLGGITVGTNKIDVTGGKAIVDSGTSLLVGDNAIIEKMNPYLGTVKSDCSNLDQLPDINFELNGQTYTLTSKDWVL
jgi:cathepsin D